jgi:hypothetical protein
MPFFSLGKGPNIKQLHFISPQTSGSPFAHPDQWWTQKQEPPPDTPHILYAEQPLNPKDQTPTTI